MKSAIDSIGCSFSGSFPHLFISAYIRENTITIQICDKKVENKEIKFCTWNKPSDFRVYNDTFNCEIDTACYVAIIFFYKMIYLKLSKSFFNRVSFVLEAQCL